MSYIVCKTDDIGGATNYIEMIQRHYHGPAKRSSFSHYVIEDTVTGEAISKHINPSGYSASIHDSSFGPHQDVKMEVVEDIEDVENGKDGKTPWQQFINQMVADFNDEQCSTILRVASNLVDTVDFSKMLDHYKTLASRLESKKDCYVSWTEKNEEKKEIWRAWFRIGEGAKNLTIQGLLMPAVPKMKPFKLKITPTPPSDVNKLLENADDEGGERFMDPETIVAADTSTRVFPCFDAKKFAFMSAF